MTIIGAFECSKNLDLVNYICAIKLQWYSCRTWWSQRRESVFWFKDNAKETKETWRSPKGDKNVLYLSNFFEGMFRASIVWKKYLKACVLYFFTKRKHFRNYERWFLFRRKISFCSPDIQITQKRLCFKFVQNCSSDRSLKKEFF